jgi:hypothetical protein
MTLAEVIESIDEPHRSKARLTRDAHKAKMQRNLLEKPRLKKNAERRAYNEKLRKKIRAKYPNLLAARDEIERRCKRMIKASPNIEKRYRDAISDLHRSRERLAGEGSKGLSTWSSRPDARCPSDWARLVGSIPEESVRSQVACLIWWDFFGMRIRDNGEEYWDHLDDYMEEWVPDVPERKIAHGLIECGYHPYDACARSIGGDIRS